MDYSLNLSKVIKEAKLLIYMLSFLIKLIYIYKIYQHKENKYVTEGFIKAVQMTRKIHFLLFNLIVLDVAFIGTRTVLHAKIIKETRFRFMATMIILGMIFYDTVEIAWVASSIVYSNANQEAIKKEEEKKRLEELEKGNVEFELDRHEKSKASFGENKLSGFGMRDYFYEKDMEKYVITKEKARNIGYVRVLDY